MTEVVTPGEYDSDDLDKLVVERDRYLVDDDPQVDDHLMEYHEENDLEDETWDPGYGEDIPRVTDEEKREAIVTAAYIREGMDYDGK